MKSFADASGSPSRTLRTRGGQSYVYRLNYCWVAAAILASAGCHHVPSVRYRDPCSSTYECDCACGSKDCYECTQRREAVKSVPWPRFHPVPTRPVFSPMPQQEHMVGAVEGNAIAPYPQMPMQPQRANDSHCFTCYRSSGS